MKKTLVAMAALAAVSAFAQSNVTLYGRVDNWFGQTSTKVGNGKSVSNIVVNSGGYTGSRWGMRGSEDLGGGLKANFQLESRISTDVGANTRNLFDRQSWLGFSGGFGEVKVGRTTTPMDDVNGVGNDHFARDAFNNYRGTLRSDTTVTNNLITGTGIGASFDARFSNGIKYTSPNFGGITGAVHLGFGEGKTGATTGAGSAAGNDFGFAVKYANGPLAVSYAYQNEKDTVKGSEAEKFNSFNAAYDFGAFAISGAIDSDKEGDAKYQGFNLGASMPLGALTLGVGFNQGNSKFRSTKVAKGTGFGLTAEYAMSKRTRVYGGIGDVKTKYDSGFRVNGSDRIASERTIAIGVRHDF